MNAKAAFQSVVTLMARYRIPFLMAGSPRAAAVLTESLLLKWLREHAKALDEVRKASKRLSNQIQGKGGK